MCISVLLVGANWRLNHRRSLSVLSTLLVQTVLCYLCATPGNAIREVFCTSETFQTSCPVGQVVIVRRALYGRLAAGRCITSEYAHALGCYADVTAHVQDACSGAAWRQNCTLLVATVDAVAQPCGKDFKSYLDIEHDCIPASFSDDCLHGNRTTLTSPDGYLALFRRPDAHAYQHQSSDVTSHRPTCPWLLVAETGRRFNVSWRLPASTLTTAHDIFDGGSHAHADVSLSGVDSAQSLSQAVCTATWKIVDPATGEESQYAACLQSHTVRPQPERTFLSTSNYLEIHFTGPMSAIGGGAAGDAAAQQHGGSGLNQGDAKIPLPLQLLHFVVIGCSDLTPPDGGFVSRHLDSAAVICNQSSETYYVTCRDGQWTGLIGNCSTHAADQTHTVRPTALSRLEIRFENGVLVAILVGITLGAVAGAILLCIVFHLNRRSRQQTRQHSRRKQKDPYSPVTLGNDTVKAGGRHVRTRHDDVIFPALIVDDGTFRMTSSACGCYDCACSAQLSTGSRGPTDTVSAACDLTSSVTSSPADRKSSSHRQPDAVGCVCVTCDRMYASGGDGDSRMLVPYPVPPRRPSAAATAAGLSRRPAAGQRGGGAQRRGVRRDARDCVSSVGGLGLSTLPELNFAPSCLSTSGCHPLAAPAQSPPAPPPPPGQPRSVPGDDVAADAKSTLLRRATCQPQSTQIVNNVNSLFCSESMQQQQQQQRHRTDGLVA